MVRDIVIWFRPQYPEANAPQYITQIMIFSSISSARSPIKSLLVLPFLLVKKETAMETPIKTQHLNCQKVLY